MARIELTTDQLTPLNLDLEEAAIVDNSTHDQTLSELRDRVVEEVAIVTPTLYSKLSDG